MPPTPVRSVSMAALERDTLQVHPGMTIFWIGDLAHQGGTSGHNPDDYPPLRAELTDADNIPEVRALDFMIGPKFSPTQAQKFVNALVATSSPDRNRIYYIIYNRRIYRRANNFRPEQYSGGDPHTNHVHVSGHVSDDNNGAPWRSVLALGDGMALSDTDAQALIWRVHALINNLPVVAGGPTKGEKNLLAAKVNETEADVEILKARPQVVAGPVDTATIEAAVRAVVLDPATTAAYATAVNDEEARRQAS